MAPGSLSLVNWQNVGITSLALMDPSVRLNSRAVMNAEFIHADMTSISFVEQSFDAVTAFYAITHVPREEHSILLTRIAGWLKPKGIFLASLGAAQSSDWRGEWLRSRCSSATTMLRSTNGLFATLVLASSARNWSTKMMMTVVSCG